MQQIQEWYLSLDGVQQAFWSFAIISSLIFCVQMIMTLIGIDHDLDVDASADVSGDTTDFGGLSLFSIRSVVNFFVGFGWAGVCLADAIPNTLLLVLVSMLVGVAFGSLWFFIRRNMMRLESNGAYKVADCVGKVCTVYLRIPARNEGMGKVQVSINGSIHEIAAATEGNEISTGMKVKVLSLLDDETLLVEKM